VPLWLSASTALDVPEGMSHPEKVWLVSPDMGFRDRGVVGEQQFGRRKDISKVPAACYAQGALGKVIIGISNGLADHPAKSVLRHLEKDIRGLLKHARKYGVETHPFYDPEHACGVGEGICFTFRDWSKLRVGHQFLQTDYSDMDYGLGKPVIHLPQTGRN
jgi:hypothetical protein